MFNIQDVKSLFQPAFIKTAEFLRRTAADLLCRPRQFVPIDETQFSQHPLRPGVGKESPGPAQIFRAGEQEKAFRVTAHLADNVAGTPVGAQDLPVLPGDPGARRKPRYTGGSADDTDTEVL